MILPTSKSRKISERKIEFMAIDCDVENGRTIRVCNLVPNVSTYADVLSMLNSQEIESENHPTETFKTVDLSERVSIHVTRLKVRKVKDSTYTLVRVHHKSGTNEIILRNAMFITTRELRRRICHVLKWNDVKSLNLIRLSTSLDLKKTDKMLGKNGVLQDYISNEIKTGTVSVWAKDMSKVKRYIVDTPAKYLTRACHVYSSRPCLGTYSVEERHFIENLLSSSLERRKSFYYISYKNLYTLANRVAAGLRCLCRGTKRTRVGICAPNSIAWSVVDFSCMLASRTYYLLTHVL